MQSLETLLIFVAASVVLTATPGPDMLLIVSRTVAQGRAAGFLTLAGAMVGTVFHGLAAALGLSQLIQVVPSAYEAIRWMGALYLLWLSWQTIRTARTHTNEIHESVLISNRQIFTQGLLTNVLNPKMVLFVLALFPQFYEPTAGSMLLQFFILAMVINVVGLVVNGAVVIGADKLGARFVRSGPTSTIAHYLLGTVFAALAIRLVFSKD